MFVFFYFKCVPADLQLHRYIHVHILVFRIVLIVFYISAAKLARIVRKLTLLVHHYQYAYIILFPYAIVICTKGRCGMYDTGTIFRGHKVAGDHTPWVAARYLAGIPVKRHQLIIPQSFQFTALKLTDHLPWQYLAFARIYREINLLRLLFEVFMKQRLSQYHITWLVGIRIIRLHQHIIYVWPYGQSAVAWQCPRSGGPRHQVHCCGFFCFHQSAAYRQFYIRFPCVTRQLI